MRTMQGDNKSFPSGDSAQGALYGFYILNYYPRLFRLLGGAMGQSQFILSIAFSRVYFHCHYMGDTMGGMFIGIVVGVILHKIGLKSMLKEIFFKYGLGMVGDDIYSDDL